MVSNKPRKQPAVIQQPVDQVHELADSIINTVREPLITLDQDLRVITVSRSFYEVFKVKPEETVGQLIYDLGNKQWDIPRLRELLENILPQKATFDDYEVEHDFATIGRRIMLLNARRIQGVLSKERGILLAIEDITERKEIEKKLLESEARYRTLIEAASDQIFVIDSEMKILSVNSSAAKLLHKKPQDIIGKSQTEIFPDQIATDTKRNIEEVFKTGMPVMKEDALVFGDQNILCNTSLSPLKDLNGNVIAVIGIARDITEIKRAEEALRDSEHRLRTLVQAIPDLIWLKDKDGVYLSCNTMFARFFGAKEADIVGKTDYDFVDRELADSFIENDNKAMVAGKTTSNEEWITFADDGHRIFLDTIKTPMYDSQGTLIGILGIGRDITDRSAVERTRKALRATVQAIAVTVEARDPYTAGHQRRVADLASAIATEMSLPTDRIEGIRIAAAIHDLGKISVPAEILSKPTKLTNIEFMLIKTHPQSGFDILKDIDFPWPIARIVLEHHEKMNGSGYPNGLMRDDILMESRVLAVADVVEAISSHRPYRPTLGIDAALEEISKNKGKLYDADVVDACVKLFKTGKFEFKPA